MQAEIQAYNMPYTSVWHLAYISVAPGLPYRK